MKDLGRLITAMVTPFKNNGEVDFERAKDFAKALVNTGSDGLLIGGTTGESPSMNEDEKLKLFKSVKDAVGTTASVIAGTTDNNTIASIDLSKKAEKLGVDAILLTVPAYNKPTQEGLYQHYKAINDKCGLPIIIYNIPGRSVIDMSVETMTRLFELKNIVGVKDATGDLDRVDKQLKAMGKEFIQLTGNDDNALEFNKRGGVGTISVTANIAPKLCSEFQTLSVLSDDKSKKEAKNFDKILQPLHNAMFIESNPSPVKFAAKQLGLCDDEVRLPLVKVTEQSKEIINKALWSTKLIK